MNFIADLQARNLLQDITPGAAEQLDKEMTAAYIGFDPTADSLHVGSLLPITLLMRLQRSGHKPYALVGGATGMVGDPSGKSAERNLLDMETIGRNCDGIRRQLEKFLDFSPEAPNCAVMVNNYDWFRNFSFLEFIRDVGKHISVNYMLAKDSVQKRLETGMSFTEFSYQLIQGYDFYYLYTNHDVKLQMGGADQWGNIVTGTELIRRKGGGDVFGFTGKLITKSDGSKFGKSEGGNIWLDRERTSPYLFYQFWLNLPDEDAAKLALVFSFKPVEEILELTETHNQDRASRKLQKALASEMTTLVHSAEDLAMAKAATAILFGSAPVDVLRSLTEKQLTEVMEGGGVPKVIVQKEMLANGLNLLSFLADTKISGSKGEARKLVQGGGMSINCEKVKAIDYEVSEAQLLHGRYLLLQKGKKEFWLGIFE